MTKPRADSNAATDAPPPDSANAEPGVRPVYGALTRAQIATLVGAGAVMVVLIHKLSPILTPFFLAAIVAYIGSPLVTWAHRHKVPRAIGALAITVLFYAFFTALLLILIPLLRNETATLVEKLPLLAQYVNDHVVPWLSRRLDLDIQFDISGLRSALAANKDTAESLAKKLLASAESGGLALVTLITNLLLMPIVMFYLLRDWAKLFTRLDELLPKPWQEEVRSFFHDIDAVLSQFLRGELTVMVVLAGYYTVGLSLAGLEFALPIGVITGLLVFIPYVGFGLGLVLGVIAAFLQFSGWQDTLPVLAVYGLGQVLEGFFLMPRLVGKRIGLHPLMVIFALLAFAQLLGFFGVLLALPISATLVVALRRVRARYLASGLYRGN
jgi:predicted PurR-regulated permease PerM